VNFGELLRILAYKAGENTTFQDEIEMLGNSIASGASLASGWVGTSPDTIEGATIRAGGNSVIIDDNGIKVYNGATQTGWWKTNGNFFTGSNLAAAATTSLSVFAEATTYNGEAMGAGDALLGDNTAGSANVLWDKSEKKLKLRGGTTTQGYIDVDGKAVFGGGSVNLDIYGLKLINNGITCVDLQVDGDTFFGSDVSAAATTGFITFATDQTYNGEVMGAGDVLFGDNSNNKANMLWDVSDGQMKFRSGQMVQGWIDIDGTTYFSGGAVKLSASEFTSETLTNCDLETVVPYATGGTITTSGGKRIHTFTADGTLTVAHGGAVEILVVGGGGGGGFAAMSDAGGGGGAGGLVYNSSFAIVPGAIAVTVGTGGAAATSIAEKGTNGEDSVFSTLTAIGGGGGGSDGNDPTGLNKGANGGSGGGAAAASGNVLASSGTSGQGYGGGAFTSTTDRGGTGGGGASETGFANNVDTGGAGGDGTAYSISGGSVTYAGGGGGGGYSQSPEVGGAGGSGGGGNGGGGSVAAVAGLENAGGGGGGGRCRPTGGDAGAAGGSGIVIISYTDNAGAETFDDWTDTEGDGTITNELTLFHDGAHAAKLVSGATSNTKIAQAATVTASTVAQLTFWTRGDGTYAGRYAVYDVSNATYITVATSTGVTGTVYEQLTFLVNIPAGCTSARVELWCPATNTGIAYFDDIHFKGMTIGNVVIGGQISAGTLVLGGNAVNEVSTDGTMAGNSDTALPTEAAVKTYVDTEIAGIPAGGEPGEGFLQNGKIAVTVANNDLTVAIKTLAGANPSAGDPVTVRIGDAIRTITAALSVTKADATNWCNAGSAELATKEVDYFVYLGYNATDGIVIGFSRIPYARLYSDFSATAANEKYCGISTITNAAAGDNYCVVGRFAATLSAGAGYTWTVPTFTAKNLIQYPIFDTRWLTWVPTLTADVSMTWTATGGLCYYKVQYNTCNINYWNMGTTGGTASSTLMFTCPFVCTIVAGFGNMTYDTTRTSGFGFFNSGPTKVLSCRKYDGSNYGLGAYRDVAGALFYAI
jgi:hypothetical protein